MKLSNKQINQYIKEIKKEKWYRQGGAITPYLTTGPYYSALHYYEGASYYKGEKNYGYFNKDKEKIICEKLLNSQRKNRQFINNLINRWKKLVALQNNILNKLEQIDLSFISNKKLVLLHSRFIKLRIKIWLICIFIEAFDAWGDYFIRQELKKHPQLNLSTNDLAILTKPLVKSYLQRQRLELLEIALNKNKNKPNWQKKISIHLKKWYYIHNTWAYVEILTSDFLKSEIKKWLKNVEKSRKERQELKSYEKEMKTGVRRIIKNKKLPFKLQNILYFFRQISTWRDERKEQVQKVNFYAYRFLKEFSRRNTVSPETLRFIDPLELKALPLSARYINELKKREKNCIYIYLHKKYYWITGNLAEKIRRAFDSTFIAGDLKGVPANNGMVRGAVKVVITKGDFKKIKKGDVLVTQMTRPEFLPILHNVSAIVTDEGGITCHAAIVSRELGIPCVIATQVATNVLKDGDKVLVDANKGIISKFNPKISKT